MSSAAAWKKKYSECTLLVSSLQGQLLDRRMQQKLNNAAGSGDKDDFSDGLSLLASGLVELESLLTQAESLGGEPQEVTKKWEKNLLELNKQYDRIQSALDGGGYNTTTNNSTAAAAAAKKNEFIQKRQQLLAPTSSSSSSGAVTQAPPPPPPPLPEDSGLHLQFQQRVMQDQDVQLDVLSQAIDRQKQVGILITDELESQIDLLQDTEEQVDRTQSRLAATSRRLDTFFKDQGFDMRAICIIIILVVILILILSLRGR